MLIQNTTVTFDWLLASDRRGLDFPHDTNIIRAIIDKQNEIIRAMNKLSKCSL